MSGKRVLVTRPEPGASATAQRLRDLGFEPVVLPLSRTEALDVAIPDTSQTKAVLISSSNAVRHASDELIAALRHLPFLAVGDATAKACRDAGIGNVVSVNGDAADLGDAVQAQFHAGDALIYLCGRVRRPELEARLAQAGLLVAPVEIYDTIEQDIDTMRFGSTAGQGGLDIGLIFSPNGGKAVARLFASGVLAGGAPERWISISRRAAEPLEALGVLVEVSQEPTETAILSLLW